MEHHLTTGKGSGCSIFFAYASAGVRNLGIPETFAYASPDFAGKGGKGQIRSGRIFDDPTRPPPEGKRARAGTTRKCARGKGTTAPGEGKELPRKG